MPARQDEGPCALAGPGDSTVLADAASWPAPPGLPTRWCSGAGSLALLGNKGAVPRRQTRVTSGWFADQRICAHVSGEAPDAVTVAPETVSWPCSHQARASSEATTAQPADLLPLSRCDRTGHQTQRDRPLTLAVEERPEICTASPHPLDFWRGASGQCWGLPAAGTRSWIPGAGAWETRGEERGLGWI